MGHCRASLYLGIFGQRSLHSPISAWCCGSGVFPRSDSVPEHVGAFKPSQQNSFSVLFGATLTTVIGAPLAGVLIAQHGAFGLEGWRFTFMGVAIPAIVVVLLPGSICRIDPPKPSGSRTKKRRCLPKSWNSNRRARTSYHASIRTVLFNARVWTLALIYFGFVYGLYALAFFLPTIIAGFEAHYGAKFNVYQKGLITAIPYLPAAIVLYLWSRTRLTVA